MSDARDIIERELAPFEAALAEVNAEELDANPPRPDVLVVLERARALQPERVEAAQLEALAALEPVASLRARPRSEDGAPTRELDPFLADYRAELDAALHCQRVPALAMVVRARRARAQRVALAVGLAAAVVLAFSLWRVVDSPRFHATAHWQAERVSSDETASDRASVSAGAGVEDEEEAGPLAAAPDEDEGSTGHVQEVERDGAAALPASDPSEPAASQPSRPDDGRSSEVDAGELRQLDRRARAQWRAGRLPAAERTFRELVARGGRHRLVELAFGDLFTLSRQLHGERAQPRLWREYLARFPRGRFADDARAGLCTRARADARARCWTRYLRDFPSGAHSREARRRRAETGADSG